MTPWTVFKRGQMSKRSNDLGVVILKYIVVLDDEKISILGKPGTAPQKVAMKLLTGIDVGPARFPQINMKPENIPLLERDLKNLKIDTFQK